MPVWAACCHSGGYSDQAGQLGEIVGSHCHRELEVELLNTTQHWPRQSADGLAPPEWLLNPLALLLADLVSTVADSATIDGGEAIGRVLRYVAICLLQHGRLDAWQVVLGELRRVVIYSWKP